MKFVIVWKNGKVTEHNEEQFAEAWRDIKGDIKTRRDVVAIHAFMKENGNWVWDCDVNLEI